MKNCFLNFLPLFLIFSIPTLNSVAQQTSTLEILSADLLQGANNFERLLGSVKMKHQNSMIFCDSAHFFRGENRAQLFGNVKIQDIQDPITTSSKYAEYDGNTKIAKLRNQVVFTNQETTLYTEYLDYNRETNVANYFNTGKVVDSANVLTSQDGFYEINYERISFKRDVVLVNPDYTLKTNDLIYLTIPKTAETEGLTNLVSKEGYTLDAQKGSFYNTQKKQFRFYDGIVENDESRVKAQELFYNEQEAYYEGSTDVRVLNKERRLEVFGDVGKYWEKDKYSEVFGNALVRKYFESDTLFLAADSLISKDSGNDSVKYLLAFHQVRMIKSDLSGKADSLFYNYSDSSIHLFDDPVLWNKKSQLSADSMVFFIANEKLDRVFLKSKAFSIMTDTLLNFNQMKGRKMTGIFEEGQIQKLIIEGNGESLYYALEADTLTQGVNRILSASIELTFEDGYIKKSNFGVRPDGKFIPTQKIDEKTGKLEGFKWRIEDRPFKKDLDKWRAIIEIDPGRKNLFDDQEVNSKLPFENQNQLKVNPLKRKPPSDLDKKD